MRGIAAAALAVVTWGFGCAETSNAPPTVGTTHLSSAEVRVGAAPDPKATTQHEVCIHHGGGPASGGGFSDCWVTTVNPERSRVRPPEH